VSLGFNHVLGSYEVGTEVATIEEEVIAVRA
jgi:hypothetical protein